MSKRMRRMAGKVIRILTGRQFLTMVGLVLISSVVSYASSTSTGLPWETPLQTVKQSLTGPGRGGHFSGRHRRWRYGPGLWR